MTLFQGILLGFMFLAVLSGSGGAYTLFEWLEKRRQRKTDALRQQLRLSEQQTEALRRQVR